MNSRSENLQITKLPKPKTLIITAAFNGDIITFNQDG